MAEEQKDHIDSGQSIFETVFFYIGILLRYKLFIVITVIVAMVGVVAFSIVTLMLPPGLNPMPNRYESTAVIRLQSNDSGLSMDSLLASLGIRDQQRISSDTSLVVQYVVNSGAFIDQLVEEFDLINRLGIEENEKTVSREYVRLSSSDNLDINSGLMYISFVATDPVFARDFVNKKIELLQDWFLEQGVSIRTRQMELLEQRMEEAQAQINSLEAEVKNFQSKYGVLSVEALAQQLETIVSDLQNQLVQVDMDIAQYTRYARIEDPALSRLRAQKQNILSMIEQIDTGYTISGRTLPSREELSELSMEFNRLTMDLQIQQEIYQVLSQRYEVLRLASIEESVFTVVEWGEVPEQKIGPYRGRMCMQVTVMAFFGAIAAVFAWHFLKKLFSNPKLIKLLKYGK